jgi:phage terminase large subunit-like protein
VKYRIIPYFWCPEAALRGRERSNRQRIDHWAKAGHIKLTEGNSVDHDVIRCDINNLAEMFRIPEIAIDPFGAMYLTTQLQNDGFEVVFVRQGFLSISPAAKEFERLVVNGMIEHDGNPVVTTEMDAAGNVKPSKGKSSEKIDGVAALLNALSRAIAEPGKKKSVYDTRGIQTL